MVMRSPSIPVISLTLTTLRMPPASRFEPGSAVGLRHSGGPPPVYDPQTELVVA